eukprot:10633469-Karenia_brevis.AAC.1
MGGYACCSRRLRDCRLALRKVFPTSNRVMDPLLLAGILSFVPGLLCLPIARATANVNTRPLDHKGHHVADLRRCY